MTSYSRLSAAPRGRGDSPRPRPTASRLWSRRWPALAAAVTGVLAIAPAARAQVPTVIDPGAEPAPEPAPEPEPAQPQPIFIPVQPGTEVGPDGQPLPPEEARFFLTEGVELDGERETFGGGLGAIPQFHVVRRGDTLWDICFFYFNNPWEWPKIWSYNPSITNPHWIYPGDLLRLLPAGFAPQVSETGEPDPQQEPAAEPGVEPAPVPRYGVKIRQRAFVEQEKLDVAARIVGAQDEKTLLSTGDIVYLAFPKGQKEPKSGAKFTIYAEQQRVKHPNTDEAAGAYVRILGELRIQPGKVDRRPVAVITSSVDAIERGALVGPLQRTFETVRTRRNKKDVNGTIVALIDNDQLIGEGQLIFVDVGKKDGVEVGNRMNVIRRGDAYSPVMAPASKTGQDDKRFPARSMGQIMIVQTGRSASVALVTLSLQEFGVGDKVEMRRDSR